MTAKEAEQQEARLMKFRHLDAARSALYSMREKMDQKSGGHGTIQSHDKPFTANTRESRRITWMKIGFSSTPGGEPPVELELNYLGVPASELGRCIEGLIEKRLAELNAEIEKL